MACRPVFVGDSIPLLFAGRAPGLTAFAVAKPVQLNAKIAALAALFATGAAVTLG